VPNRELVAQIGARIKLARTKAGLSQHDLAMRLGYTAGAVGQWEIGKNLPQMTTFDKLPEILGVTRNWLRNGDEDEEQLRAQDNMEVDLLRKARSASTESKLAAITVMDTLKSLDTGNPTEVASLIETWAQLTPSNRAAAIAMIDGLSRTGSPPTRPEFPAHRPQRNNPHAPSGGGGPKSAMSNA